MRRKAKKALMAQIGRSKTEPNVLVAHANDEGFKFPLVHCTLDFKDHGDNFIPALTFVPIIDSEKDEESQRRLVDKLKMLIIESLETTNALIQWDFDSEPLILYKTKEGKRLLVPANKLNKEKKDVNRST